MFVGNISQYEKESRFLPEYIRPWIEKLSSLVKSDSVSYTHLTLPTTVPV